jgi:hypothetical protein
VAPSTILPDARHRRHAYEVGWCASST